MTKRRHTAEDEKSVRDAWDGYVRLARRLYKNVTFTDGYGGKYDARVLTDNVDEAELVSSEIANGLHCPVLDLDVFSVLIPSSTEGHNHLYINRPMTWRQYKRILKAMAKAGVLEKGYVDASLRRGHTSVRVPWLKKENNDRK